MPLYTIATQSGTLDARAKADLAAAVTSLHAELSGVPKGWVHVVFQDYPPGDGFAAGVAAPTVHLTAVIREGRTAAYVRGLLAGLWTLLQHATGAPDELLVVGIQEVPADRAMEMGRAMPEVAR